MMVVDAPACPVVRTREVAGIEALFDPRVHLVVWERPTADLDSRGSDWPANAGRLMRTLRCKSLDASTLAATLALRADSALAADLLDLCELFSTLTGAAALGVRVDITDRATCPRFHADQVTLRMMTTYRGPATQWLQDGRTQQASPGDVLLAKGLLWPDLRSGPCVHRSPQPDPGQTRVLVTLDAL